jgi:hypothetical protein
MKKMITIELTAEQWNYLLDKVAEENKRFPDSPKTLGDLLQYFLSLAINLDKENKI